MPLTHQAAFVLAAESAAYHCRCFGQKMLADNIRIETMFGVAVMSLASMVGLASALP